MKKYFMMFATVLMVFILNQVTYAHCEMPCGIYDDAMRIKMIRESIATIEKAMKQIDELSKAQPVNYNQLVRWVNTKEEHATKIQETASEYFMCQRIKPAEPTDKEKYDAYILQLTLMHELQLYAMKSKQTIDLDNIQKMKDILDKFEIAYFGHKLEEAAPGK
jgi:nickel superoxide dismutase